MVHFHRRMTTLHPLITLLSITTFQAPREVG